MAATNKPRIRAYIGATGSGKGVSVNEYLQATRPARLVVWDPQQEWQHLGRPVSTLSDLCMGMDRPSWRLVYYPGPDARAFPDRFAHFCRAVYAAGDCTALVEELADVTTPSFAPPAWGRLNTSGRHRGVEVIACTQSPAYVDKKFLNGCTYIRCFTLREDNHQKRMASVLGVTFPEVQALETTETDAATSITYYERDYRTGARGQKTIVLKRKK